MHYLSEFLQKSSSKIDQDNFSVKEEFLSLSPENQEAILSEIKTYDIKLERHEFIELPDTIKKGLVDHYKSEFEKLKSKDSTKEEYAEIKYPRFQRERLKLLESIQEEINSRPVEEEKGEKWEIGTSFAEYSMVEPLNELLSRSISQILLNRKEKFTIGEKKEIVDLISLGLVDVELKKEGDQEVYYVNNNRVDDIKESDNDGIILTYKDSKLEDQFLNLFENLYYERLAYERKLSPEQMVDRGLIKALSETTQDFRFIFNNTSTLQKLYSIFDKKNSFLHLCLNKLTVGEFNEFVKAGPNIFKEYLNLLNEDNKKLIDIVSNAQIKKEIIHSPYWTHSERIINNSQSIHSKAVHITADKSLVKLAKNFCKEHNIEYIILDENLGRIDFDNNTMTDFANEQLNILSNQLGMMLNEGDSALFEDIKFSLSEEQKKLPLNSPEIESILKFKKFQLSKANSLINDVIKHGLTSYPTESTDYTVSVNIKNSQGLSIKEMIALCFYASSEKAKIKDKTTNKLYNELETDEDKKDLMSINSWSFIEGLYKIRRGYNDNIDATYNTIKYKNLKDQKDKNICAGGTINNLALSLSERHEDIYVPTITNDVINMDVRNYIPKIINEMIDNTTEEEKKIEFFFLLNEWRNYNKMPNMIKNQLIEKLREKFNEEENDFFKTYAPYYNVEDLIQVFSPNLENMNYPRSLNFNSTYDILSGVSEGFEKYIDILPHYTKDKNFNHMLTIDFLLERNPNIMFDLIKSENVHKILNNWVLKDNKVINILSKWLKENIDIVLKSDSLYKEKIIKLAFNSNYNLESKIFSNFISENFNSFLEPIKLVRKSKILKNTSFIDIIDEKRIDLLEDDIKEVLLEIDSFFNIINIVNKIPIDKLDKYSIEIKAALNKVSCPEKILKHIPQNEKFPLFTDAIRQTINNSSISMRSIMESIPSKYLHLFKDEINNRLTTNKDISAEEFINLVGGNIDSFVDVISNLMIKSNNKIFPTIIDAIPEEKRYLFKNVFNELLATDKWDYIVRIIPDNEFDLYKDKVNELLATDKWVFALGIIPDNKFDIYKDTISENLSKFNNLSIIKEMSVKKISLCLDEVLKLIQKDNHSIDDLIYLAKSMSDNKEKLTLLINPIVESIKRRNPKKYYIHDIITAISPKNIDLIDDLIRESIVVKGSVDIRLIRVIKENNKIDDFKDEIRQSLLSSIAPFAIIQDMPSNNIDDFKDEISTLIKNMPIRGYNSSYIEIFQCIPENKFDLFIDVIKDKIMNSSKEFVRDLKGYIPAKKLLIFVPEFEEKLKNNPSFLNQVRNKIGPDVYDNALMAHRNLKNNQPTVDSFIVGKVEEAKSPTSSPRVPHVPNESKEGMKK